MNSDTIFAVATPPGRGAIAVVRLSGPAVAAALRGLIGGAPPPPRRATRVRINDPATGEQIPTCLGRGGRAPARPPGEAVAALPPLGGRPALAGLVEALAAVAGLRPAEPGEFTRRAFDNGKLDLTEAEAVADLVDAETAAQRRQALRQLGGALGTLYDGWASRLVRALAHLEAHIDFADEDLPDAVAAEVDSDILLLEEQITQHLGDNRRGERLRDGVYIAILGPPNVGKSSLLNVLARRPAAIVSATAGTTRDVVEAHLDLGGYPVVVADTAGLREAADEIEREGVARALARAERADLKIVMFDAASGAPDPAAAALVDDDAIAVVNKIDLAQPRGMEAVAGGQICAVSITTGVGMEELLAKLEAAVASRLGGSEAPALTRARHRSALEDCVAALRRARAAGPVELVAEDLRLAVRSLGRITGRVGVEDLLDVIFRDFCIGK